MADCSWKSYRLAHSRPHTCGLQSLRASNRVAKLKRQWPELRLQHANRLPLLAPSHHPVAKRQSPHGKTGRSGTEKDRQPWPLIEAVANDCSSVRGIHDGVKKEGNFKQRGQIKTAIDLFSMGSFVVSSFRRIPGTPCQKILAAMIACAMAFPKTSCCGSSR